MAERADETFAPAEAALVAAARERIAGEDWLRRLGARDAGLWTGGDEASWLGWLDAVRDAQAKLAVYQALAVAVYRERFTQAVLLGMGGSSLGPEVLRRSFGVRPGYPDLLILDSTVPGQVRAIEEGVDLAQTLVIVASKSGSTLEPNLFLETFYERLCERLGKREAGRRMIAITDPGSKLEAVGRERGFRVIHGVPAIGGRFSVLSAFGLVPAAVMGIDLKALLERAVPMAETSGAEASPAESPGVRLGAALGALAQAGRNKVTIVASPGLRDLGAWLEQLLAESTGKNGTGLVPVDREPLGAPAVYGADRVFVYVRQETTADPGDDVAIAALARAGQPVMRIAVEDVLDLGGEFFRWEVATAVAGAVLGIHPFDQPDVEAAKVATRKLVTEYEERGALPESPALGIGPELAAALREHLGRFAPGEYCALLAYLPMNPANESELTAMRVAVRDRRKVATCVGFGPRYLHSTGQAYKGGPPTGVFLFITADPALDLAVPGQKATYGVVSGAQARGDMAVLRERGRRVLHVHLGADLRSELAALRRAVIEAVA